MENLTSTTSALSNSASEFTDAPQTATHISAARLAANRANAKRSTGPRTPRGKARSASNSFKHGLFSLKNFDDFCHDNDMCLAVVDNYLAEFEPVTSIECALVHQLIQFQLRFLQMEALLNTAMRIDDISFIANPPAALPLILRELNLLPTKIQKCIKVIRDEQLRRDENTEIEPIDDLPPLPPHSKETRDKQKPSQRAIAVQRLTSEMLSERFAARIVEKFGHPDLAYTPDRITEQMKIEAKAAADKLFVTMQ